MSEPVLERSVLERKERDELQTIAKALGAHPTSRLRKAELVDLILRTAGIGGDEAPPVAPGTAEAATAAAPARGRGRRAAPRGEATDASADATPSAAADQDGPDTGAVAGRPDAEVAAEAEAAGKLPGTDVDGAPAGPDAARRDVGDRSDEAPEPRAPAGDRPRGQGGDDRNGRGNGSASGQAGQGSAPGDRSQSGLGGQSGPGRAPADRNQRGQDQSGQGNRNQGGQGDRNQSGQGDRNQANQSGQGDRSQGDRNQGGQNQSGQGDRNQGDRNQGGQNQSGQGDRSQGDRNQGGQNQSGQGDRNQGDRNQSGDRNQVDRSQGNQADRANQQGGQGGQQGEDGEGGNRRRRRRNRDRGEGQGAPDAAGGDEPFTGEPVACAGLLDLRDEGYGFLRVRGYLPHKEDVYVSVRQVRQLGLRKGDHLTGASRPANRQEKNPALLRTDLVNGQEPDVARQRPRFEDLTPLFPDEKLKLETGTDPTNMTARIVDLVSPIGKGQRGLIVSPPKAGKTTILKQIVKSIERNNPDVHLMVLLVDERPEEVTDMRRSTGGEVIASTFDRPSEEHTAVSELAIERAKRLVEDGRDVVVVLDGITRLARAYNLAAPGTGRIMSGGIDTGALYPPKKFFGAARNVEEGGSLTILATALIETGSKMDEVIFEEFKGTGNMELRLDRRLAERRIYPAIDVDASSTRHEELLFSRQQLQQVWRVRRALHALTAEAGSPAAALERLMDGMKTFKTNDEFLAEAAKAGGPAA